jgi:nitrate/TMAO reductase-like tetraheme cytochrome c subunit
MFNRPDGYGGRRRRRWPRSRAGGCLLWVVLLIVVLVVLSLLFGGFQKGTKENGLGRFCTSCTSAPIASAQWRAATPL